MEGSNKLEEVSREKLVLSTRGATIGIFSKYKITIMQANNK